MKKLIILFMVLVLFLGFVSCYDIDGDGIDDGGQNLCGDYYCQDWEDEVSCPSDCIGGSPEDVLCGNDICEPGEDVDNYPSDCFVGDVEPEAISEESIESVGEDVDGGETTSLEEGEETTVIGSEKEEQSQETSFISSLAFKIIIIVIVLIITGIMVYIIYRKRKIENQGPEVNNQTSKENLSK